MRTGSEKLSLFVAVLHSRAKLVLARVGPGFPQNRYHLPTMIIPLLQTMFNPTASAP
jgi:hypothetical protein